MVFSMGRSLIRKLLQEEQFDAVAAILLSESKYDHLRAAAELDEFFLEMQALDPGDELPFDVEEALYAIAEVKGAQVTRDIQQEFEDLFSGEVDWPDEYIDENGRPPGKPAREPYLP